MGEHNDLVADLEPSTGFLNNVNSVQQIHDQSSPKGSSRGNIFGIHKSKAEQVSSKAWINEASTAKI